MINSSKQKVAFLISASIGGGAQILLKNLVSNLKDRFDIIVFCPNGFLCQELEKINACFIKTEVNLKTIKSIKDKIDEWAKGEFVILNPFLFGTAFFVCREFKDKSKYGIFSLLLNPIIRDELSFTKKIAYKYIARVIGNNSDAIGVGSPELRDEVKYLTGRDTVYLENRVPNIVKEKRLFYDGRRELNLCFVGRLANQKNPMMFLETAKLAKKEKLQAHFYMVGEGELFEDVVDFIDNNVLQENVTLVPFQNDLYTFLEKMDILLMTSTFENTPLIMLNAMNASMPTICGNVTGVAHLISNEEDGIVLEEYTAECFKEAIKEFINDKSKVESFGRCAYRKATNEYSYDRFIKLYADALQTCKEKN